MKKAFTLIELLVVILIIGILAAIALPQYQISVVKTRYAGVKLFARNLAEAEKIYYLANGTYTGDAAALDISSNICVLDEEKGWSYCYFDWGGDCDIRGSLIACYMRDYNDLQYRIDITTDEQICATRTEDLSSIGNKICANETGKTSWGGTGSGNYYWYYE